MISEITDLGVDEISADVCVVGAGPVGIALALLLGRAGQRVCLLESGGALVEDEVQTLNQADIVGRTHLGIHQGRFRALGGSSTRWGGQLLPYEPINFETRDWIPGSGWPISLRELEPYYEQAYALEGMTGSEGGDERLMQIIAAPDSGLGGLDMRFSRWCPQPNFAELHAAEIRASELVHCVLHATVTCVNTDKDRIDSVCAKSMGGSSVRVRAQRFVFCGGAIETARLLLQPTEQNEQPPWAGPGSRLGQYFQDHPTFECADVIPVSERRIHQVMDMIYLRGFRYQPRFHLDEARQRELRSLSVGGLLLFKTRSSDEVMRTRTSLRALVQKPSAGRLIDAIRVSSSSLPYLLRQSWRYLTRGRAYNPSDLGIRLIAFCEQLPRASSRVTLTDSRDALGMRRAALNWELGEEELSAIRQFSVTVKAAFEAAGLAQVVLEPDLDREDKAFLARGWDNYHHMGTARAAATSADGVVDSDLKMFHCENAFICGCAVFPTGGFANPTHTAIALAVRLAGHLTRQDRACN